MYCDILSSIWGNANLCFGQKYTLTSRLGGGDQDLDVGLTFRIDFSICEIYEIFLLMEPSSRVKYCAHMSYNLFAHKNISLGRLLTL